jgi:hypothetical protein
MDNLGMYRNCNWSEVVVPAVNPNTACSVYSWVLELDGRQTGMTSVGVDPGGRGTCSERRRRNVSSNAWLTSIHQGNGQRELEKRARV